MTEAGSQSGLDFHPSLRHLLPMLRCDTKLTFFAACAAFFLASAARAETAHLAQAQLARLEAIQTLQCDVRKDFQGPAGRMRMLSRVYYAQPDRLHVENHAPVRRRIVSDGRIFRSHVEGHARGFARPIEALSREMQIELRKVPATAADHLLRVRELEEEILPSEEGFPIRRGYAEEHVFTVLSFDDKDRIARVDFYDAADRATRLGEVIYQAFEEVLPNVWIARRHEIRTQAGALERAESVRFSNVVVNGEIADGLFDAAAFFHGVDFVDDFNQVYETPGR